MNKEQFKRETNYRVAIAITKTILSKKIINDSDYRKIDKMLKSKYKPVVGGL